MKKYVCPVCGYVYVKMAALYLPFCGVCFM